MNQEQEVKKLTKDQLKVIALRQRIGEITSNYEETLADMRADITQQSEAMQEMIEQQFQEIQDLKGQLNASDAQKGSPEDSTN
jgi:hypothetical protein